MPGWLESFLIALFLAVGEKLAAKGRVKIDQWKDMSEAIKRGEKYDQVIKDPNSSLEDRLRAEDELGS